MALPAWEVRVPLTRKSFNLKPGPFSVKENVLVVIAAASGATYNLACTPLALSELYFGKRIDPAVSIFFSGQLSGLDTRMPHLHVSS